MRVHSPRHAGTRWVVRTDHDSNDTTMTVASSFNRTGTLLTSLSLTVLFCSVSASLLAQGSDSWSAYNTTFYDRLDPDPPVAYPERYSALWGYTAPDGREYALLGGYRGMHIVDITEQPIREVAFVDGPDSEWREMKTFGHYAYVVNETRGGMQIVDLSNLPESAEVVATISDHFETGHTITQEGDWLYVNGVGVNAGVNQGTMIFNVAENRLDPPLVGSYAERYVHDVTIRGNTMYAAAIIDGQLDIVDLGEDRTNPTLITSIVYPGAGTHNSDLTTDGRYLMTTDEVGETDKSLKVWNIEDLDDIYKVADWSAEPNAVIHNVRIIGDLAYISWYTGGTRIADISDPTNPVEIAHFDEYPGEIPYTIGNWEIYPYFESGKLIASDMNTGLWVFTLDVEQKGTVSGVVRDAETGFPLPGAVIDLPQLNRRIYADDQGRYEIAAGVGELSFSAKSVNYLLNDGTLTLAADGISTDIMMTPLELRHVVLRPIRRDNADPIPGAHFDVITRGTGSAEPTASIELDLPNDSAYTVVVGAWGYRTKGLTLATGVSGTIDVELIPGYADNAEVDLGWTKGIPTDDATNGRWSIYTPRPGSYLSLSDGTLIPLAPEEDRTPNGTHVFGTVSPSYGIDSGSTTLLSPEFDLTEYPDPELSFQLWYTNDAYFWVPSDDRLTIEISVDGGESWTELAALEESTDDWETFTFRVKDFVTPSATMRFRIVASDIGVGQWVMAAMDEFQIVPGVPSAVPDDGTKRDSMPEPSLSFFPNPTSGYGVLDATLEEGVSAVIIDLMDAVGRRRIHLYDGAMQAGRTQLPVHLDNVPPGRYILRFLAADGSARYHPITILR